MGLTPIQREFFQRRLARPEHYNQSVVMEVGEGTDSLLLEGAVKVLVRQHDALRLCFEQRGGEWRQSYAGERRAKGYTTGWTCRGSEAESESGRCEEDADGRQASLRLTRVG